VVAASKLSDISSSLVGNLAFVACLSEAFVPAGLNQSTIDDYKKGGALVFYDASAPLKLLLTQDQNRKFLTSLMSGPFKIGDVRSVSFSEFHCGYSAMCAIRVLLHFLVARFAKSSSSTDNTLLMFMAFWHFRRLSLSKCTRLPCLAQIPARSVLQAAW